MKKFISAIILSLVLSTNAGAVLKEKDLASTLTVLRSELKASYEKQQLIMEEHEAAGARTHQQLVNYMTQCEQISLMLYSQNLDNIFEMTYACDQATNLHEKLSLKNGKNLDYDEALRKTERELEEYDALIHTLKAIPPFENDNEDFTLSAHDSLLFSAIDSLSQHLDTTLRIENSTSNRHAARLEALSFSLAEHSSSEPLFLSGKMLEDRSDCLYYAKELRSILAKYKDRLMADKVYYDSVREKVEGLNNYAMKRYDSMQQKIFTTGDRNFFASIAALPDEFNSIKETLREKYINLDEGQGSSDWKGVNVLLVSVSFIFYLLIVSLLVYLALKYMMPAKWKGEHFESRRQSLSYIISVGLIILIIYIIVFTTDINYMLLMSCNLLLNIAWLIESIFISNFIRLDHAELDKSSKLYAPFVWMAVIVAMFRITLFPNSVTALVFPPLILVASIFQAVMLSRYRHSIPNIDQIYLYISQAVLIVCTILSFAGYSILAIQIIVLWCNLLSSLLSVQAIQHIIRKRPGRILKVDAIYEFVDYCLIPILYIVSIPFSIYYAADIFEMTSSFKKIFYAAYVNSDGMLTISLYKLCVVAILFFIFRYLNNIIRAAYQSIRKKVSNDKGKKHEPNTTLSRNVIAILCWGLYLIMVLAIFNVPKNGISLVTAGLATGLGFAMKDLLNNFVYGISLMTGRLRVGDIIECDGVTGYVNSISYQNTTILTFDGTLVAFLNSALFNKNFRNLTRNNKFMRGEFHFSVAYGSDIEKVRQVVMTALIPLSDLKTEDGKNVCDKMHSIDFLFDEMADSSLNFTIRIWARVDQQRNLKSIMAQTIYNALNEAGISIPFPQCDVHLINEKNL